MKVIYVAGPYRADTTWQIELNTRAAEELALEIWQAGAAAICPHANSRFFQGSAPDDAFVDGYLEILRRCDAMLLVKDDKASEGTQGEIQEAGRRGIPIFTTLDDLLQWLREA
jgi:hypothetical protein